MKNIITDYGATGNGVTDDTAAFTAATAAGGLVYVPAGSYNVNAASDAAIIATIPTKFFGDPGFKSIILANAAMPAGVDCFTIRPMVSGDSDGWGLQDIAIAPASGSGMRYAVRIDLSATGAYLARAIFERMSLTAGASADAAFKLDNPNNTDGLFCGEICGKGIIIGGIKLLNVGDSFSIKDQTITGRSSTDPNVGIYMQAVPGAAQCRVQDNNITTPGGAMFFQGMNQVQVEGNQCEQSSVYDGPFNGMITMSDCLNSNIFNNNLNSYGNITCVIIEKYLNTSQRNILRGNVMIAGAPYFHVNIGPGCPNNGIADDNRFYNESGTFVVGGSNSIDSTSLPMWSV